MRLYVYVLQAKDLAVKDTYVKLQVGKFKSKTRTLRNTLNPVWNEEFIFRVHDVGEQVVVSVFHHDDDSGFFNASKDLVGRVTIPVRLVADGENQTLPPTWLSLEKPKTGRFISKDCGKILLTISLHGKGHDNSTNHLLYAQSDIYHKDYKEFESTCILSHDIFSAKAPCLKITEGKHLVKAIAGRLEKLFNKTEETSRTDDSSSDLSTTVSDHEDFLEGHDSSCSFEEAIELMQSQHNQHEMPENLEGGILLDQMYTLSSYNLNKFLFAPDSQFRKDLADLQGTTDVQEGPWTWKSGDVSFLTRVITYTKAATKLVKAVKATEEQTYIKANGREFAILITVSAPQVPYGSTFKIELLYKIMPGPELPAGEESSRLIISWRINFQQSTMMRSMIEGGVKQGLKESFDQFSNLLAQNLKILDLMELSDRDHMLSTLQTEHQSDWELATEYFWNFTVVFTIFMVLYLMVHLVLCDSFKVQGLEIDGLELPDSFGELITGGILIILLQRVYNMVSHFIQARLRGGSDHGVKAQGDGWVLTVALIEGVNLASLDSTGFSDPYVVFTCNGKTRTSSVKLQTRDPQWNEILEFDAMEEPPSVLNVEVFDFDGPFDQAASLGHAEINFLKHTSTELADLRVSLEGKLAQSSQSKLRLRIFLDNNKGVEAIKDYLSKMEKEVGKKLNLQSPHRNSTFQKLFGLPPVEFLISDFTCHLKRKLPVQGRLFLSARIVGFYANLFGHKTKFFFLWEDIEDIQVLSPSLASVGSPSLVIVLRKGRGLDARHGAKSQDEEGRLRFYFQPFVSFNVASRTIMALWRTRTLTPDQKAEIVEEQQDQEERPITLEEVGSILDVEDANMSKIYTAELPISITSLMEIFDGGKLEHKIMEKSGCLNYATTVWEPVKPGVSERQVSYKFNRHISIFGGEVTCTQQKSPIANDEGWILNEVMVLYDVPFCDHFRVHFMYQIEKSDLAHNALEQRREMQHDEVIWQVIRHKHCSFMSKISTGIFCRNPYNVTGICNRSSCPLANSRYSTIRDHDGVFYLYMKTIERAHKPNDLWERVKLPKNYEKALEIIDKHLRYWPKLLVHKIKQRLTKMTQMRIRMRKLALKTREKIMTTPRKEKKREARREEKAEKAAVLDKTIEKELLARLENGIYDGIYNLPFNKFIETLDTDELQAEDENEEESEVEYVEGNFELEEEDDIEDLGMKDHHISNDEVVDDDDDDDEEVNAVEEKRVRRRSKSAHEKSEKDEPGTKLKKKSRIHVEVEHEDGAERQIATF